MRKITLFSMILLSANLLIAGKPSAIKLISSTDNNTIIEFIPGDFILKDVITPNGPEKIVVLDKATPLLETGAPDLPKLTRSLIIPDLASMEVKVVSSSFYDITGINIAPSKGNFTRDINPVSVPFTYNSAIYSQNNFFPSSIVSANAPYILRDYRGQAIHVCPFQYNPQTKILRVYTNVVVSVKMTATTGGVNSFERTTVEKNYDKEFEAIYQRQFINYLAFSDRSLMYSPVAENGSMLVICYDAFSASMEPFVIWKNRKGVPTEMVLKSSVGTTAIAIKTYITNYYAANPNLKYVLLVGDAPQIPSSSVTDAWGTANDSDNNYGYLNGSDSYPEVFIGRFSATNNTHVQTMVMRILNYEETPQASTTWYKRGITIASDQGPGDDGEMDFEHQRAISNKMLAYTYSSMTENFDGSQGGFDASGDPTPINITADINAGAGVITYTGHGSDFSFGTSGFSVSDIGGLTNTTMHPFIWSVACVNGNFVPNTTCFAEGWLRAGTPTAPKGALSTLMSTINQSWNPPMEGQDAMVDILVESVSGNIKRTFGGLSMNGCMQMNDAYGINGDQMTDTWTLFGDPSVMVFTDSPAPMVTAHITNAPVGTTSVVVNNNTIDALICLSSGGTILGTGVSDGTSATITIPAATAGVIDVVATAYNKMPYSGTINISVASGVNENNNGTSLYVYPVPAENTLNIVSALPVNGKIRIAIYNNLGQEIMLLANENVAGGTTSRSFDISSLSAGSYFCRMETESTVKIQPVVIQK